MVESGRVRQTSVAGQSDEHVIETVLAPASLAVSEPVDFVALGSFFRRHWLLILGLSIVSGAGAYGLSHFVPKVYRAYVLLAPVSPDGSSGSPLKSLASRYGSLAGLAGINLDAGGYATATVVAMLQSRRFIEQFIADNNLLPVLFSNRWDTAMSRWKGSDARPPPSLEDGYEVFSKRVLTVTEDRKTNLITLQIDWLDGGLASVWANTLVARVNATTRALAIENANRSIEYLNLELRGTESVELRQSIFSLLQSQMDKRMMASTRPEFAFTVIDPAQPPNRRRYVKPNRVRFALFGLAVGALLGIGVAAFRDGRATQGPK